MAAMPLSSSYFNWETTSLLQTTMNNNDPDMMGSYFSFFHEEPPPPLPPDYSDYETFFFLNQNTNNNYNNNPNSFLFDHCYSFPSELTYPPQQQQRYHSSLSAYEYDDDTFQYPNAKRQRKLSHGDNYHHHHHQLPSYHNNHNYLFYDGFEDNNYNNNSYHPSCCSSLVPEFNDVIGVSPLPPPQLPVAAVSEYGDNEKKKKKWCGEVVKERVVSAQSVAARERRKRIADKTEELGKMVPGGSKMNTADMLLSASKYVKYLQAQVSMLQLINNNTQLMEDMASTLSEDQDQQLQAMLGSASVEEQLYLQEKCLVPQQMVTSLTNHADIQTRPSILKDLNQLIVNATDTEKKQLQ